METARIYATIPIKLKEKLDKIMEDTGWNVSNIVAQMISLYYGPPQCTEVIQRDIPKVTEDMIEKENIEDGLTIPKIEEKPKQDKDIKPAFTIEPRPGAYLRLKNIGINPQDVINARRAKRAGRDYNKELEKYFESI